MAQMTQLTKKAVDLQQDSLKDLRVPKRDAFPNLSGNERAPGSGPAVGLSERQKEMQRDVQQGQRSGGTGK